MIHDRSQSRFLSIGEIVFWGAVLSVIGLLDGVLVLLLPSLFGMVEVAAPVASITAALTSLTQFLGLRLEMFLVLIIALKVTLFLVLNRAVIFFISFKQVEITKHVIRRLSKLNFVQFEAFDFNQLLRLISASIPRFIEETLFSSIRLLGESSSLVIIVVALILLDPLLTVLLAAALVSVALVFRLVFTPVIRRTGRGMIDAQGRIIGIGRQYVGGFKEIKIDDSHSRFLNSIDTHTQDFARLGATYTVIQLVPRQMLELIFFFVIVGTVSYLVHPGRDLAAALAPLSAFAFAGIRCVPALNNIISCLNKLAVSKPIYDELRSFDEAILSPKHEVRGVEESWAPSKGRINVIAGTNVGFSYNSEPVFSGVAFRFSRDQINVIAGPSGCGKSTLTGLLLNQLGSYDGVIEADGKDISSIPGWPYQYVKYNSQRPVIYEGSIEYNIVLDAMRTDSDRAKLERILDICGLSTSRDFLDRDVGDEGGFLSGGEKQRIALARALFDGRSVLILDEPTAALDSVNAGRVREALQEICDTVLVIVISHDLELFSGAHVLDLGNYRYDARDSRVSL